MLLLSSFNLTRRKFQIIQLSRLSRWIPLDISGSFSRYFFFICESHLLLQHHHHQQHLWGDLGKVSFACRWLCVSVVVFFFPSLLNCPHCGTAETDRLTLEESVLQRFWLWELEPIKLRTIISPSGVLLHYIYIYQTLLSKVTYSNSYTDGGGCRADQRFRVQYLAQGRFNMQSRRIKPATAAVE